MKKECLDCKNKYDISNFYKTGKYFISYCKSCFKKRVQKNMIIKYGNKNLRKTKYAYKLREIDKEYQKNKRIKNPSMKTIERREYCKRYPERIKANYIIFKMIKEKKIKRLKCRDCERKDTYAHHPNYLYPQEVIWLCPIHHKLEHLKIKGRTT